MNYIVESAKYVVDNAKHVNINEDAIFEFCKSYSLTTSNLVDELPFPKKEFSKEEEVAFYFVLESLSFSTWGDTKWCVEYQGKEIKKGTYALIAAIYRALDAGVPILNSKYLSSLTLSKAKELFRGNIEIPLLKQRHQCLVELGSVISKKYSGSFLALIEESKYDVKELLSLLVSNFPMFKDEVSYEGEKVYFYKLAQLLVHDIIRIYNDKTFSNIELLTALADYKIPYILHSLNVLEYDPSLTNLLEIKKELTYGSEMEVEIRAATIMGVNLIYFMLKNTYPTITLSEVNDFLWLQSTHVSKEALPHHRTRSVHY
jgi:hypothetical protein